MRQTKAPVAISEKSSIIDGANSKNNNYHSNINSANWWKSQKSAKRVKIVGKVRAKKYTDNNNNKLCTTMKLNTGRDYAQKGILNFSTAFDVFFPSCPYFIVFLLFRRTHTHARTLMHMQ